MKGFGVVFFLFSFQLARESFGLLFSFIILAYIRIPYQVKKIN